MTKHVFSWGYPLVEGRCCFVTAQKEWATEIAFHFQFSAAET
jgi:hypothetical protein